MEWDERGVAWYGRRVGLRRRALQDFLIFINYGDSFDLDDHSRQGEVLDCNKRTGWIIPAGKEALSLYHKLIPVFLILDKNRHLHDVLKTAPSSFQRLRDIIKS
jgi:hypothetical protein